MRLDGKTAIITGAASGIGAGTAQLFAEHGARLILVDWNRDGLEEVRESLHSVATDEILIYSGDVSERSTAEGTMALAIDAGLGVDILFNNAGIMESPEFLGSDDEAWDRLMAINLRGMMLMARAVLPGMVERGAGSIVNTSSVMAFLTEPNYEAYTTSKAAIIGFTKSLAVTYAERGIRSNCICPGWVDTPMNRQLAEEMGGIDKLTPIIRQQQPLGRMVTTREVAHAVLFLASEDASGITGVALPVDGAASSAI